MELEIKPDIRCVVFDLDGLLFNTEDLYDQVSDIILSRRKQTFSLELKHEMMGKPAPVAFQIMKDWFSLEESIDQLQQETEAEFESLLETDLQVMPGVSTLMQWIDLCGLPRAIATSSRRRFALKCLEISGLADRFEFVLTAEDVKRGKPDPEIYCAAADRFACATQQMLVFEDSLTGSRAASASGACTIAVPGHHSAHLVFDHVDLVVSRLDDPKVRSIVLNSIA